MVDALVLMVSSGLSLSSSSVTGLVVVLGLVVLRACSGSVSVVVDRVCRFS